MERIVFDADHEVRVTVVVEISRGEGINPSGDFVQAKRGSDIAELVRAEIAPNADAVAKPDDIQPAVVVVVDELEFNRLESGEPKAQSGRHAIELNRQGIIRSQHEV